MPFIHFLPCSVHWLVLGCWGAIDFVVRFGEHVVLCMQSQFASAIIVVFVPERIPLSPWLLCGSAPTSRANVKHLVTLCFIGS